MKTKKDLSILTVMVFCFLGTQSLFAQESVGEILQKTLAAFKNDAISEELTPILNNANEAEILNKLLDSFIAGTKKIDVLISQFTTANPNNIAVATKELEKIFNELDVKAALIFAFNANSRQTALKNNGATRMRNETIGTINALRAAGLKRPANQMDNYRKFCFSDAKSLNEAFSKMTGVPIMPGILSFEKKLNALSAQKEKSNSSGGGYESNTSHYERPSPGSSDPSQEEKEPPKKLTWTEQADMLRKSGIDAEQVMPLCKLLADSIDADVFEKRRRLQMRKQQIAKKTPTSSSLFGGLESDSYGASGETPTYNNSPSDVPSSPNVTVPLKNIPVNSLFDDVDLRIQIAFHLKQAALSAKGTQQIALLKAWCALSDGNGVADVCGTILFLEEQRAEAAAQQAKNASTENGGMSGDSMSSSSSMSETGKKESLLEALTVLSDYQSDPRVLAAVFNTVQTDTELATQLCFNVGGSIQNGVKAALLSPEVKTNAKITLIQALQYIGRPDASDSAGFLLPLLNSNNPVIVEAAADAISEVGDRRASVTLVKGLKNARLADTIKTILKKMGSESQNDVIPLFQEGNTNLDEICVEILGDGGDINALSALAKVLRRYHNAESKANMPQKEKNRMLLLTMQAGINIISRNMGKNSPELIPKPKPVFLPSANTPFTDDPMTSSYEKEEISSSASGNDRDVNDLLESGSTGESGQQSNVAEISQLKMSLEEIKDDVPYEWLTMVYIVTAKHLADAAEMMGEVRTAASGRKIGGQIYNENVGLSVLKQTIKTSEEGLSAYMQSKNKLRILLDQKGRAERSLKQYQRELKVISKNKSAYDSFSKALLGGDPNVSSTNAN
ncbi:MAG: HEAT repeat domain-containing protein [Planctomycetaceae bacterium]|jgi:hypothetical protein|nr:HEAT repeat domain-containing protein [Planctomycetaceae bacterium]